MDLMILEIILIMHVGNLVLCRPSKPACLSALRQKDDCPKWHYCDTTRSVCKPCNVCRSWMKRRTDPYDNCKLPVHCASGQPSDSLACPPLRPKNNFDGSRVEYDNTEDIPYLGTKVTTSCVVNGQKVSHVLECTATRVGSGYRRVWNGTLDCVVEEPVIQSTSPRGLGGGEITTKIPVQGEVKDRGLFVNHVYVYLIVGVLIMLLVVSLGTLCIILYKKRKKKQEKEPGTHLLNDKRETGKLAKRVLDLKDILEEEEKENFLGTSSVPNVTDTDAQLSEHQLSAHWSELSSYTDENFMRNHQPNKRANQNSSESHSSSISAGTSSSSDIWIHRVDVCSEDHQVKHKDNSQISTRNSQMLKYPIPETECNFNSSKFYESMSSDTTSSEEQTEPKAPEYEYSLQLIGEPRQQQIQQQQQQQQQQEEENLCINTARSDDDLRYSEYTLQQKQASISSIPTELKVPVWQPPTAMEGSANFQSCGCIPNSYEAISTLEISPMSQSIHVVSEDDLSEDLNPISLQEPVQRQPNENTDDFASLGTCCSVEPLGPNAGQLTQLEYVDLQHRQLTSSESGWETGTCSYDLGSESIVCHDS